MAPSAVNRAIGAAKDKASIGLAKVSGSTALSELEVAVVKATSHDEYPAEEKHVRDILALISYSHANIAACAALLARRLGKTRSWAVALKTLVLVHRLLADGGQEFEEEVFFATRMLNMSGFRDGRCEYSAFVRAYSRYLDERLEYKMQGRRRRRGAVPGSGRKVAAEMEGEGEEIDGRGGSPAVSTPVREMPTDGLFAKAQCLQNLLDRFLACRPTGPAKTNRIAAMALYPMVKESFQIYFDLSEIISAFVDRFTELPVADCVRTHELFFKFSKQFEELAGFHSWSRSAGVARSSDYPEIEHITQKKLDVMGGFILERTAREPRPAPMRREEVPVTEQRELGSVESEDAEQEGEDLDKVDGRPVPQPMEEGVKFPDLRAEPPNTDQHADKYALVLFEDEADSGKEFKDTADWEKELFGGKKPEMAGGFNMLTLNEMYGHANGSEEGVVRCSSIMAMAGPEKSQMLALPSPAGGCVGGSDPFAASAAVAPPAWVQMSEMERKQHLLVEEQLRWQHYAMEGMPGKFPPAMCPMGGYQQRF